VQIIEKIRRLRTSKAAFLDDGPYNAYELLCDLENKLLQFLPKDKVEQKDYIIALRKAADALPEEADEVLFQELSETKNKLLMKFLNKPSYNTAFFSDNILEIYRKAKKSLQPVLTEKDNILCTLLKSVEDSSSEIADTIRKYNIVFAATAQQSEGNRIKLAKQIDPRRHPVYDTVIIDEAARVNPGDLMIPMSQAKRRIIFVGDHRQLPHVYDEEIFEAMKDNGSNIGKDTIKKSMFQYLKEKTEELTRQDGKKRSITLDAQFRMHPDLGKFISDNFYRPYGEGFLSPLGAENFAQNISKKPYQWVNIPSSKGKEEKVGTSRRRKCEAEYIVNTIQTYLDGKGENLSYGIITFYKAQADVIKKMLQKKGLNDKVRVGSVDAFQGMEFDVIFLSVVRSSSKTPKGEDIKKANEIMQEKKDSNKISERENFLEETGMRYYGFLTKENRLCVALSRQKKLLIVVGDSYIFSSSAYNDLASVCVPALHKFYLLCKEGGQVING